MIFFSKILVQKYALKILEKKNGKSNKYRTNIRIHEYIKIRVKIIPSFVNKKNMTVKFYKIEIKSLKF